MNRWDRGWREWASGRISGRLIHRRRRDDNFLYTTRLAAIAESDEHAEEICKRLNAYEEAAHEHGIQARELVRRIAEIFHLDPEGIPSKEIDDATALVAMHLRSPSKSREPG